LENESPNRRLKRPAEVALKGTKPLSKNAYKIEIAKTLVKRAILGICG